MGVGLATQRQGGLNLGFDVVDRTASIQCECTFEVVGTPVVGAWALARLALAFITLLGVAFYLEMSFLAARCHDE